MKMKILFVLLFCVVAHSCSNSSEDSSELKNGAEAARISLLKDNEIKIPVSDYYAKDENFLRILSDEYGIQALHGEQWTGPFGIGYYEVMKTEADRRLEEGWFPNAVEKAGIEIIIPD